MPTQIYEIFWEIPSFLAISKFSTFLYTLHNAANIDEMLSG